MIVYTSIEDMPVYNWFKCIENKEYKYVLVDPKTYIQGAEKEYTDAFKVVYNEYVDTLGVSEQLQDIIAIQNEIWVLKIDKALTGDNFFNTLIELKELELVDKLKVKQSKTNTAKIAIEKYLGFRVNEREVTVKEYYDYLEAIKEHGRSTD